MTMETERVDLSPLDPTEDQLRYERLVRQIMDAAEPELVRRTRQAGPLAVMAGWARPTLAAAAIIAILALGGLTAIQRNSAEPMDSMVEALGVPAPAAEWLEDDREPDAADLVLAMERR
ncbi:MAG: hypothetical protein R6U63_16410 [Longimicrobiales bacterium]